MRSILKSLSILAVLLMLMSAPALAGTAKPVLSVVDIKVSPGTLMAGDTAEITVTIANSLKAAGAGNSTTVTNSYNYGSGVSNGMPTPAHTETTTTTSTDSPDSNVRIEKASLISDGPVRVVSQSFEKVGSLGMGDTAKFTFLIKADSNTPEGTYFLKFLVRTGDDEIYVNYPVPVQVDNSPVRMVLSESPKSFGSAKKTVVFDVVNLRGNEVSSVSVLPIGDEFSFRPMQEYYIGTVGSGEMYTVQFDVSSKNSSYSADPQFKVVYKNGNNWHESQVLTVSSDRSQVQTASAGANNDVLMYVVGGVVVLGVLFGGLFLFMRGKRAKQ